MTDQTSDAVLTAQEPAPDRPLAVVSEALIRAQATALRMLLVVIVCLLVIGLGALIGSVASGVAAVLNGVAILFGLGAVIIFVIQTLKLILARRSTLEMYADRLVWTVHPSLFQRGKQIEKPWRDVVEYLVIASPESQRLSNLVQDNVDPRMLGAQGVKAALTGGAPEAAGAALLYLIFGRLPDRVLLRLKLRDGSWIRLAELSGDVARLNQVALDVNPGTVYRMGPGHYTFRS